jgi:hypothetical protein
VADGVVEEIEGQPLDQVGVAAPGRARPAVIGALEPATWAAVSRTTTALHAE